MEGKLVIYIADTYQQARCHADSQGLDLDDWWQFGSFLPAVRWLQRCADFGAINWNQTDPPPVTWRCLP